MADEYVPEEEVVAPKRTLGIFTILAGVGVGVCFYTPRIALATPVLVTIILACVAIYQGERPGWFPAMLAALAFLILLEMQGGYSSPKPVHHSSDTWEYGADQTYGDWGRIYSSTDPDLAPPYDGDNPVYLQVSSVSGVLLVADKGQITFPFDHCTVQVNAFTYPCNTPPCGSTTTAIAR